MGIGGDPDAVEKFYATLATVEPEDVQRVIRTFLRPGNRVVVTLARPPATSQTASVASAGPALVCLPIPSSPFVCITVVVRAGSIDDPAGREGLAYVHSQAVTDGGTQALTQNQVSERLQPLAARLIGRNDKELTTWTAVVHRDHAIALYDIFRELLLRPRFADEDVRRVRDEAVEYLTSTLRSEWDEQLGKEILDQEIHRGHPYGHCHNGTVAGLQSIATVDVRSFHDEVLTRERVTVGLAGSFSAELEARVRTDFGALPSRPFAPRPLPPRRNIGQPELTLVERPGAEATAISLGFPLDLSRIDRDYFPLLVAVACFGEHRSFFGRLMNRMRVDRGLNYGDYAYLENFIEAVDRFPHPNIVRRAQFFSIWIRPVESANAPFALRLALRELHRLVADGLTDAEVADAKKFVINNAPLWAQTLDRRLGYIIDGRFFGSKDLATEVREQVPAVTTAAVNAAIRRHLNRDGVVIVAVTDDARQLRDRLISNQPSPMDYGTATPSAAVTAEDATVAAWSLKIASDAVRILPAANLFTEPLPAQR